MKPQLKIVEEPPIDIAALNRADAEKRDWSAVHCAGDKGEPLLNWQRTRRPWRG